jgi:hypothetical protein
MVPDPRHAPRHRDRALDRLTGLTTSAAVLGVLATAGLGTVAALTTHVPGVSAVDASGPDVFSDESAGGGSTPVDPALPTVPSVNGSTGTRPTQPSVKAGNVSPSTGSTRRRHASTGGS